MAALVGDELKVFRGLENLVDRLDPGKGLASGGNGEPAGIGSGFLFPGGSCVQFPLGLEGPGGLAVEGQAGGWSGDGGRGQGCSKGMPGNRFEGLWSRLPLSGKGQSQGEQNEGDPDHETPRGLQNKVEEESGFRSLSLDRVAVSAFGAHGFVASSKNHETSSSRPCRRSHPRDLCSGRPPRVQDHL